MQPHSNELIEFLTFLLSKDLFILRVLLDDDGENVGGIVAMDVATVDLGLQQHLQHGRLHHQREGDLVVSQLDEDVVGVQALLNVVVRLGQEARQLRHHLLPLLRQLQHHIQLLVGEVFGFVVLVFAFCFDFLLFFLL